MLLLLLNYVVLRALWKIDVHIIRTLVISDMCRLCESLHDADRPATVYTDLEGWVRDDICEKVEVTKHGFS